ncbi:MAG TPA: diguanylate cyclase [Aquabacterium sp.]|uniref:GGDEF domain-containing protein n=1 Tax=Aquabacterium sp. TaxID=1872578 RepID=UPI002E345F57|nr:diguanylate cyclase [Aquabacterium sp.]HEX5356748.1 diguanylate cyclase [Aquabacterium sp.]
MSSLPPSSSADIPKLAAGLHDPLMARINQLLDKGFPWMRFPGALEQQFLLDVAEARRRHFVISSVIALLIYNGFLVADYLMARDVFWLAVEIRILFFTPLALLFIYLIQTRNGAFIHSLPTASLEVIVVSGGLIAAGSLAFILSETRTAYAAYYHVGFTVVVLYGNVVQRLRFWYAVVFSTALLGIHLAGIILLGDFPQRLLWPIFSMVLSAVVFSLTANYLMERDERKRYLLTLRERGVVRELTRAHERLQELSRVDALTGLHNRRHFQEYLQQVWERAQYDGSSVSILMVDVDHFKKYNDRYGHPAGDECLSQIARVLQTTLRRPEDLIARYGGEEFIAVLPQTETAYAVAVAERVRVAVEALQMRHESSSASHFVTVSIGVVSCKADFLLKSAALVSAADQALYQAKHEGRNRICVIDTKAVASAN